jgi:hypothetical protein
MRGSWSYLRIVWIQTPRAQSENSRGKISNLQPRVMKLVVQTEPQILLNSPYLCRLDDIENGFANHEIVSSLLPRR